MEFLSSMIEAMAMAGPLAKGVGDFAVGIKNIVGMGLGLFRKRVPEKQLPVALHGSFEQIANMPQPEFDQKVDEIIELKLADQPQEDKDAAKQILQLVREKTRTKFAAPGVDPERTRTTIPSDFFLGKPEDLIVDFFPKRLSSFKPGQLVPDNPRWVLERRLAFGGFGEVWKAHGVVETDQYSVFKFPLDPAAQRRILENERENIRLVRTSLKRERHVVKLLDSHLDGETPWLQYEYIPGGHLADHFATWPKDIEQRAAKAVEVVAVLAGTMQKCHAIQPKALIHRDLKPQNVLVDEDDEMMITDFGIGSTQSRHAIEEANIGTILAQTDSTPSDIRWAHSVKYASPQQIEGQTPHPSDDVHALGVILFQMVAGDIYMKMGKGYEHILRKLKIARPLIEVITVATADKLEDRYQHAGELLEALKALPKELTAEPLAAKPVDPQAEEDRFLAELELRAEDAKAKNNIARQYLERREWKPAVAVLESVHPVLRNEGLYQRAIQHRDGKRFTNSVGMEFSIVPKGEFWMRCTDDPIEKFAVTIRHDFYMGIYPITRNEYQKITGKGFENRELSAKLSNVVIGALPVVNVSWHDANQFIAQLNKRCDETGWLYRLPQNAEWEYACRGAPTLSDGLGWNYYFQIPSDVLSPQQANFKDTGLGRPSTVGSFGSNSLGLYDMHGNVWEWMEDGGKGNQRVMRGGSFEDPPEHCTAENWYRGDGSGGYAVGFRVVRVPTVV